MREYLDNAFRRNKRPDVVSKRKRRPAATSMGGNATLSKVADATVDTASKSRQRRRRSAPLSTSMRGAAYLG